MNRKPPVPLCSALLTCRQAIVDPKYKDTCLIGLRSYHVHHRYPAAVTVGLFARLTSAHGEYQVEVQVQTLEGEIVWKEGPPGLCSFADPLRTHELRFNISLVFPQPGAYDIVLVLNGEEVARQRFLAQLTAELAEKE